MNAPLPKHELIVTVFGHLTPDQKDEMRRAVAAAAMEKLRSMNAAARVAAEPAADREVRA